MSGLRFKVAVGGGEAAAAAAEGLRERLLGGLGSDWAGPAISNEIAAILRERFASGGFGSWPPLSTSTITARRRSWGYYSNAPAPGVSASGPTLVWTGRLRNSLGDPRGRGSMDAIMRMTPTVLEQGTRVPYAVHHMGPWRSRPARPPLELRPEDEARLVAVYREFVLGGIDVG